MWTLFAVLLGTGGLLVAGRRRRCAVHAVAAGLAQPPARRPRRDRPRQNCWCSPSIPSLVLPLLSPAVGQSYGIGDALVHGDVHVHRRHRALQPGVSALHRFQRRLAAVADRAAARRPCSALFEQSSAASSRYGLFGLMSGEIYFRGGGLPWLGLLASTALSVAMLYARDQQRRAPGFLTRLTRRVEMRAFTRSILVAAPLLLPPAARLVAQTAVDPSGHWQGSLQAPDSPIGFEVDLAKNARGELAGTLSVPSQQIKGLPLINIAVTATAVNFQARSDQSFGGVLAADGRSMAGQFSVSGGTVAFNMARSGTGEDRSAAESPPIAKELEGTWLGALTSTRRHCAWC